MKSHQMQIDELQNSSEPLVDELCDDYIVVDGELDLDRFHELVIGVQVHAVILQSVEPMNDMRATSIYIAISILMLALVIDILLALEKISQVRGRHVQHSSHLHNKPT